MDAFWDWAIANWQWLAVVGGLWFIHRDVQGIREQLGDREDRRRDKAMEPRQAP